VTELLQIFYRCFAVEGGGIAQFFSIGAERPSAPVSKDYKRFWVS
jgi:hypothetical protein